MKTIKLVLLVMTLLVVNIATSQNCTVNAGIDQSVCSSSATLTGAYGTPVSTTWTQITGPNAVITSPSALTTTVTGLVGGNTYRFRISTICGDGFPTYDEVVISTQDFPIANAGSNFSICTGTNTANLAAGALRRNAQNQLLESGAWTFVSSGTSTATNGLSINEPNSPTSSLSLTTGTSNSGAVVLRWTVTNIASGCTSYSDVTVTKIAVNTNVNAGSDINVSTCYNSSTSTSLNASFGGGSTYGRWSVISGPNTPTFANINTYNTTVSNLIEGGYVFRWTVTSPCMATSSDDVQVLVGAPRGAVSAASASIVGSPNLPYCDIPQSISLAGSAYNSATERVEWIKSGTGTASVASSTSRYTTVSGFNGTQVNFRYRITNIATNCYTESSQLSITFESNQTLSITNTDPMVLSCNASSATINISHTGTTTPQWAVISGPTGYTPTAFANISGTSFTPTGLTIQGAYIVRVRKVVGVCATIFDDITLNVSKSPTAANAGSDPALACNATQATLIGNTPSAGTGKWSQLSGPNTAGISTPTAALTNVTGLIAGLYEFRWTISNGPNCPTTQDDVRVRVASIIPANVSAGADQNICSGTPLTLDGNIPLANETGTWTVSPTTGVTIANVNNPKSTVTGLASNTTYTFTWTVVNNCASASDNVSITTSAILGPIAALAGADQCQVAGTSSITLAGNAPSPGTGTWTKITGANATITNSSLYNTTVTGLSDGTYKFEWAIARNACIITRDTVTITISAAASTANAGNDQLAVCGTSTTLIANTPTVGTGRWSQVGGAGGAIITSPTSPSTAITNLSDGQYTFRWTITNGACSSSYDDIIVFASTSPSTPNAGFDKTVCGATTVTMTANAIGVGTGYWNIISGPNAPVITTNSSPTTTVTSLTTGTYRFTWNSRNGLCPTQSDEVIVTVVPAASAGSNQTLCGTTTTSLKGNENTTGNWTIVTPTQTTEVITPTTDYMADVTGLISGTTYTFKYTLTNADACASSKESTMTVTVLATPTAPQAGADQEQCITTATTTINLLGNTPSVGSGTWSRVSGSGTITSANSAATTVTGVAPGISVFRWTVSNAGSCAAIDDVVITVSRVVAKSAGLDQTICGSSATLASDAASSGIGTWTQFSGPNTAAFNSYISNTATVSNLINGSYVFRWTITDGDCTPTYDEMTLNVNSAPTTPNAGADQSLCNASQTSFEGNTIALGTGTWSKVSGPTCTITSSNNPASTITGMAVGTYVFRWTASNGSCADLTDDVTIVNNQAPTTAAAGSDIRICMYSAFNLAANTPTTGTGQWSQVSGNTINFINSSSPTTGITGAIPGTYVFRWSISNANCSVSTDDVTLIIDASVTEPNAGTDINTTSVSATMDANTISSGAGVWSKISGPAGASITNVNSPTTTITNLAQGTFVYRWTATNGNCTSYDDVTIIKSDIQTYNIVANPTFTTCAISWSNGSMSSRVVFMKEGTGTITNPVNNTSYTPSTSWSNKGTQAGSSGYYCIYSGTGSSVQITGLYPGRTYTVRAFEYNGNTGSESYLTNLTGALNPKTFIPWPTTTFTNSAGVTTEQDWNTSARWDHDTIPSITTLHEAVLVYIDGNCIVNNDETSYNLTIKSAHGAITPKLTINTGSSLNITGGALGGQFVNSGGWAGLLVKSSATQATGTLTWKNGNPSGSVEMYSKASWDLKKPVNNKYKWQFIGIPVISTSYSTTFSNCYLREWDETVIRYEDVWARKNDGTSLQKGPNNTLTNNKGYELVQQYPKVYTFKGTLQHDDFVQTLSYSPSAYFKGQHIFGNPFTAAIDIRSIEFGPNTEHTVYQYNTGTYTDWIDNQGENIGIDGTELTPARYAVATKQTAGVLGILRQIPSMQGFLVKVTNEAGGSITIPYPTVMKNSIHQRSKQESNVSLVATRIDVKGNNFSDKMWIFVDPSCTSGFDNGWDGKKLPGDDAVTQIYGIESDGGEYQINAVKDINESVIAFKPGNDKDFILTFSHENIQNMYAQLKLVDMVDNKTVDITASGSTYAFSSNIGDQLKRFKIITSTTSTNAVNPDLNITILVHQQRVSIINNNEYDAEIALYDELGRCITNNIVQAKSNVKLNTTLPKGVYIVKTIINKNNYSKRIIVN